MSPESTLSQRVRALAAVADPARLAVVDALALGDRSPGDLAAELGLPSNLLAHHLNVLQAAGVVRRTPSEADRRRTYVHLERRALDGLLPQPRIDAERVVFVCTHNSARSQLASAIWRGRSPVPTASAGTEPAAAVHPGALAAAARHGLGLMGRRPRHVSRVLRPGDLVVSVCDSAHETLSRSGAEHLHWSVPDPVPVGTAAAFDHAYDQVEGHITALAAAMGRTGRTGRTDQPSHAPPEADTGAEE